MYTKQKTNFIQVCLLNVYVYELYFITTGIIVVEVNREKFPNRRFLGLKLEFIHGKFLTLMVYLFFFY